MGSFVYLTYREEFRRYVCVQLAMMKTGTALESYTKGLLEKISGDQSVQSLQPCTKGCSQQLPKHQRANWCQTCKTWKTLLEKHLDLPQVVNWEKMNSMRWSQIPLDPLAIAEVFLPPDWNKTNINIQDLSTCVGIWRRFKHPDPAIHRDHKTLVRAVEPLQDTRNAFTHPPTVTLTKDQKADVFNKIKTLLGHTLIVKSLPKHSDLVRAVHDYETDCTPCEPPEQGTMQIADGVTIVTRSEWNARRPKQADYMGTPVEIVLIHHSGSGEAYTQERCSDELRCIQNFHMDGRGWDDIGYSFLVCEDGRVYEGRGWDRIGAHTLGWNNVAISVCFTGDYSKKLPSKEALIAGQLLIEAGVKLGKITEDYRLYGHCDMRPGFAGPGQELYKLIQTWPHYDHSEPVKPAPKPYKGNLS